MPARSFVTSIILFALFIGAGSAAYLYRAPVVAVYGHFFGPKIAQTDPAIAFELDAYDTIQKNFWKKLSDDDLSTLFQLSLQKASGTSTPLASHDREGVKAMLQRAFAALAPEAKKELAQNLLVVALYNLPPAGRDQLLTSQQETALRREVSNVHPERDLYADVGAAAGASLDEVRAAYARKKTQLENTTGADAQAQLAQATYAYQVLTDAENKSRYDTTKAEPTVFSRRIGSTLYFDMSRMSPTTLQEFAEAMDAASTTPVRSLLIDLRSNIGGSLDIAPALIGLFQGQNQYVFDLYHQDDYQPIRSPVPKMTDLSRFREVVVLTDSMTQSTAEVIAAAMKRFHLATVVGNTTRGWGTVENTYPLASTVDPGTAYSLLLVQGLTLRDDNQPIETRGVEPDIDISQKDWHAQLSARIRSQDLIGTIEQVLAKSPQQ